MATYDLTSSIPSSIKAGDILNCSYSGAKKTITLPPGTYKLECWGAQGGYRSSSTYGGLGGYSVGTINLTQKTTVYLYAGGAGGTSSTSAGAVVAGGFNGGGYRYGYKGGGGGSDIRIGQDSLYARVIVAGGGGSDGATNKKGMYGGGTTGGSSTESYTAVSSYGGKGGTQTYSGYSTVYTITTQATTGLNSNTAANYCGGFGFGGGGVYLSSGYGGAGGGGWYGGSGNVPDGSGDDDRGGGGGSGYVYTSSTASNYPSGCLLNSSYYLTDATTYAGNTSFTGTSGSSETGHAGNGYVRITAVSVTSTGVNMPIKISGTWKDSEAVYVKVNGVWKEVSDVYVKVNGNWCNYDTTPKVTVRIVSTSGAATPLYIVTAPEGMLWGDWIISKYNTFGFSLGSNNQVLDKYGGSVRVNAQIGNILSTITMKDTTYYTTTNAFDIFINGNYYAFPRANNQTWAEWASSKYNSATINIDSSGAVWFTGYGGQSKVYSSNGTAVTSSDIISDTRYTTQIYI